MISLWRHILHSSCQRDCTPLDSPLTRAGGHSQTPPQGRRSAGFPELEQGVRTIPLAPFLEGRGEVKMISLWRHILHSSCQWGCTPLDSSLTRAGGHSQTPPKGRRSAGFPELEQGVRTIPLAPFLKGRGEVKMISLWRHILHSSCQRGCAPLDSPLACAGGHSQTPPKGQRSAGFPELEQGVRTIPLAPFLEGRGEVKMISLWRHILHSSCQWGCTPLDSPLACAGRTPSELLPVGLCPSELLVG